MLLVQLCRYACMHAEVIKHNYKVILSAVSCIFFLEVQDFHKK